LTPKPTLTKRQIATTYAVLAVAGLGLGVLMGQIIPLQVHPSGSPSASPVVTPAPVITPAPVVTVAPVSHAATDTPSAVPDAVPSLRPPPGMEASVPPLRPDEPPAESPSDRHRDISVRPSVAEASPESERQVGSILGTWDLTTSDNARPPAVVYFAGLKSRGQYSITRGRETERGHFRYHDGTLELTNLRATLAGQPDVLESGDVSGWTDADHFEVTLVGGARVMSGEISRGRTYRFARKR
jgi:hypothetical protein